ncbi:MAG TPA: hypothetical protein VHM02_11525, partial [Thermoanaerobaculia bacterium]|nr:hypothetical protein [Thermoanaerobaculia bacterium]
MTASPFDCVVRGFASLRANWRLVPLLWLQQVLAMALFVLGAAVPLVVLGRGWWSAFADWRPAGAEEMLLDLSAAVAPVALPLSIALLGTAVVWTLAAVAFCWFQAGSLAVLVAAERQAPPGPPRGWRVFAVYDRALFVGGARRLWRRCFGFWNLWGLAALGWLVAFAVVVLAAELAAASWGWPGLA